MPTPLSHEIRGRGWIRCENKPRHFQRFSTKIERNNARPRSCNLLRVDGDLRRSVQRGLPTGTEKCNRQCQVGRRDTDVRLVRIRRRSFAAQHRTLSFRVRPHRRQVDRPTGTRQLSVYEFHLGPRKLLREFGRMVLQDQEPPPSLEESLRQQAGPFHMRFAHKPYFHLGSIG